MVTVRLIIHHIILSLSLSTVLLTSLCFQNKLFVVASRYKDCSQYVYKYRIQKRRSLVRRALGWIIRMHVVCYRYLYYTDWGKTASVVRTRLDGSSPTVIKSGLNNPNGIAIIGSKIYVTDSNYKTRIPPNARTAKDGSLYSMTSNGGGWTDVLSGVTTKLKVNGCHLICYRN